MPTFTWQFCQAQKILSVCHSGVSLSVCGASLRSFFCPWVFTKCMVMVTAYLRKEGIHIFSYLDDWLLWGSFFPHSHCTVFAWPSGSLPKHWKVKFGSHSENWVLWDCSRFCLRTLLLTNRFQAIRHHWLSLQLGLRLLGHMSACMPVLQFARYPNWSVDISNGTSVLPYNRVVPFSVYVLLEEGKLKAHESYQWPQHSLETPSSEKQLLFLELFLCQPPHKSEHP